MADPTSEVTRILHSMNSKDPEARAKLIEAAYDDLRRIATGKMSRERNDHTMTATALVHEVAARFLAGGAKDIQNRSQLYAYAARAMRNQLIDHARAKACLIRGGDRERVEMDDHLYASGQKDEEVLRISEALDTFADVDPTKAEIVEMKVFGRMTNQEIADSLGISVTTVKRGWQIAKAWLFRELSGETSQDLPVD